MKHPIVTTRRLALLSLVALVVGACDDDDHHHHGSSSPPVFREAEPNDDVFDANYFGLLYPGDLFYIDGFSTDRGTDPFDGFAFTAGQPIHVDFRLFIDDPFADFDVCLYDPQLDEIVACYETADNPESGGVDITLTNLEFHLVINSFVGEGPYSLEIAVTPLVVLREEGEVAPAASAGLITATGAGGERRGALAYDSYRRNETAAPTVNVLQVEVDPETGESIETLTVHESSATDE
jgi:hypothetical protein